jgi:hypothetical protein
MSKKRRSLRTFSARREFKKETVRLLGCLRAVAHLLEQMLKQTPLLSCRTKHEYQLQTIALFFAAKANKSVRAIDLLIENGLCEDAAVLSRTLYEIAINFDFIRLDTERYVPLYTKHQTMSRHRLLEEAERAGWPISEPAHLSGARDELEAEFDGIKKDYKNKQRWSGKTIREMAEATGWGNLYGTVYAMQSAHVHTSALSSSSFGTFNGREIEIDLITRKEDSYWIVATTASLFGLRIAELFADTLELAMEEKVAAIMKELNSLSPSVPSSLITET